MSDVPQSNHPTRLLHLLAAVPAGLLFLVAGVSKMADFSSVAATIRTMTAVPTQLSILLAALLVVAESAGGMLLILGRRVRLAAVALAALVTVFLLAAAVLPLPEHCNCFGPLTPAISRQATTAVDLALLALLLLIAFSGHSRAARWVWAIPLALSLAALTLLRPPHPPELTRALRYAGAVDTLFTRTTGNRALLLLNAADFLCPACYQDIRQTIDTLGRLDDAKHRSVILLRNRLWTAEQAAARAHRWKITARIPLPTTAIADSLLDADRESAVAVLDEEGTVVFHQRFPLGDHLRRRLVRLLSGRYEPHSCASQLTCSAELATLWCTRQHTRATTRSCSHIRGTAHAPPASPLPPLLARPTLRRASA